MKYNPQMLKLAREIRGFTQTQLSGIMEVAQGTISKVEKRIMNFDEELACKASECLSFPLSFFQNEGEIIPIQGEHRKKLSASVKDYNANQAKMTLVERQLIKLLDGIVLSENEIPVWDVEIEGSPKMCAQFLRKYWKLPRGRVENVSLLVEKYGAIILPLNLKDMDGFSMYTTNGIPLIFINKNLPPDRYRLTVAHELGHIIMHLSFLIPEDRDKEKEAFLFAAEFLMPEHEIVDQLVKLNLSKLSSLKSYWKVSMASLIMRAKTLGTMTENQLRYLWQQLASNGYRLNEPLLFQSEQPIVLGQIIEAYLEDMGYSEDELSSMLDLYLDEFYEIYLNRKVSYLKRVR